MLEEFNYEQRSEEWLEARKTVMSASMAKNLMGARGLGVTGKNYAIETALEVVESYVEDKYLSQAMQDGIDREPIAINKYSSDNFVEVKTTGFLVRTAVIDGLECKFGCSPDGLVGEDGGLEIKCPENKKHKFNLISEDCPKEYYDQIQACLWVTGRDWWDFVSYSPNFQEEWKTRTIRVTPDSKWVEKFQDRLVEATTIMNESIKKLVHV